jgi:hypothetical protein
MYDIYWKLGGVEIGLQHRMLNPPAYFDFLPIGRDTLLLAVVHKRHTEVWRGTGSYSREKAEWQMKWTALEGDRMASRFLEPFILYGDANTWYFVTQSGRLYVAARPSSPKAERCQECVWPGRDQPIGALLTDTASRTTYAFTRGGGAGYFRLADKPSPAPYDSRGLPAVTVDGPLRGVLPYVQFLLREKKIRVRQP